MRGGGGGGGEGEGGAVGEGDICASALLFRLDFLVIVEI